LAEKVKGRPLYRKAAKENEWAGGENDRKERGSWLHDQTYAWEAWVHRIGPKMG